MIIAENKNDIIRNKNNQKRDIFQSKKATFSVNLVHLNDIQRQYCSSYLPNLRLRQNVEQE